MSQEKTICKNKLKWLNENYVNEKYKLDIETNGSGRKRLIIEDLRHVETHRISEGVSTYSDMVEVLKAIEYVLWLDKQAVLKDRIFLDERRQHGKDNQRTN
jgi:hypothetical protein